MYLTENEISLKLILISFHEYNDIIFGITGIFFNLLLFILVLKKSRTHFEIYKYILLYSRILHLLLSFTIIVCGQFIETISTNIFLIASGPFKYTASHLMTIFIPLFFSTSLYLVITSVPIAFIYRYTVIVSSKPWTKNKFYFVILINIAVVMPINIFGYQAFVCDSPEYDSRSKILDKRVWYSNETKKYRAFVMANITNIYYKLMMSYIFIIICAVYVAILFFSLAVKRKVRKANKISAMNGLQKLHNYNYQINQVLCIQALIPLIFILIPYSFWLLCILFKVYFLKILSPLLWVHISWIPTIEAIATIVLVKEFRKGLFKL